MLAVWVWTSGAVGGVGRMAGWSAVAVLLHWARDLLPSQVWLSAWSATMLALIVAVLLAERVTGSAAAGTRSAHTRTERRSVRQ